MKQEVQVTITLGVDVSVTKEEIKQYFLNMENVYTSVSTTSQANV